MRSISKCVMKAAMPALILLMACGTATAAERVSMMSPAKDAAMVPILRGMVNNYKAKNALDMPVTVNDGIVIRQSRIENGKIIIPAGGLYVTSRSGNWHPFRGDVFTIAGKEYYGAVDRYERSIVRDITFKKGQIIPFDARKTRGMELSSFSVDPYALDGGQDATFKLVKATGNYYGASFPTYSGDLVTKIPASNITKYTNEKAGITIPDAKNKASKVIYASNFFSVGRTHVIVESISKDGVKVSEMGTDNCTDLWASPKAPMVADYAAGASYKMGTATITVSKVAKDSVTVKITDKKGTVEKVLGPYNKEVAKWVPMSMADREPLWVLSKDGTVAVMLNIYKEGGPLANGKANLTTFCDMVHIQNSSVWAADKRFIATPET